MTIGIGAKVEVMSAQFLGRWIRPLEKGEVVGRHISPSQQEVYEVELEGDNAVYVFSPEDLEETEAAP